MSELEGRVGEGSLGVISKKFDEMDPKNIGDGIKGAISSESRIAAAEAERMAEAQKVTMHEEVDLIELVDKLKGDMGEGPRVSDDVEHDGR